jgi:hypothetical protein
MKTKYVLTCGDPHIRSPVVAPYGFLFRRRVPR